MSFPTRAANDTTRAQINNIPSKSHVIPLLAVTPRVWHGDHFLQVDHLIQVLQNRGIVKKTSFYDTCDHLMYETCSQILLALISGDKHGQNILKSFFLVLFDWFWFKGISSQAARTQLRVIMIA